MINTWREYTFDIILIALGVSLASLLIGSGDITSQMSFTFSAIVMAILFVVLALTIPKKETGRGNSMKEVER